VGKHELEIVIDQASSEINTDLTLRTSSSFTNYNKTMLFIIVILILIIAFFLISS
jgi:cell division protein FtsL